MLIRDFDPEPLTAASEETLLRARVFLFTIKRPEWVTIAMMADYTPKIHNEGVWLTSQLSGERPMWEWREWRALRPTRDPDLPDLVAKLDAFAARWSERLKAASAAIEDPEDRREMLSYAEGTREYPSKTWGAKAKVQCIKAISEVPMEFYQVMARHLRAEGFDEELPAFEQTLKDVQHYIRTLPIDDEERRDIHRAREDAAHHVRRWLDDRRKQLASWDVSDRTVLALQDLVPPPGFETPIGLLAGFSAGAKA